MFLAHFLILSFQDAKYMFVYLRVTIFLGNFLHVDSDLPLFHEFN